MRIHPSPVLFSALFSLLLPACHPEAEPPQKDQPLLTVEEPDRAAESYACTVELAVSARTDFLVRVPEKADWLRCETPSGGPGTDIVAFSMETNMEDFMREALVSFVRKDGGDLLAEVGLVQKAGGGIVFEPEDIGLLPAVGGMFKVAIDANVEYAFEIPAEASWLQAEPVSDGIRLMVDRNPSEEGRSARIVFHRSGKDRMLGFLEVNQRGLIYRVKLNGVPMETLEEAIASLPECTGPALIELGLETFESPVRIDGGGIKDAVTIQGQGAASESVLRGVEIRNAAVTLRRLTLAPDQDGLSGLSVSGAGYGVTVEDVTVDMGRAVGNAVGMVWSGIAGERGHVRDLVRNVDVRGVPGKAGAEISGAFLKLEGNTFRSGHAAYSIRIGGEGNDLVLDGNHFESAASGDAFGVLLDRLTGSSLTFGDGDGDGDTNDCDSSFRSLYGANTDVTASQGNTFTPGAAQEGEILRIARRLLTRLWGKYTTADNASWDARIANVAEWDRNAAVTPDRVYIPVAGRQTADYGVNVFDLSDGSFLGKWRGGVEADAGLFPTCGAAVMPDGEGRAVLVSNMVNNTGQVLKVYRVDETTGRLETVLSHTMPDGARLGDKMTVSGTWSDGYLLFMDYNKGARHDLHYFKVKDGKVDPEDHITPLNVDRDPDRPHMGSLHFYGTFTDNCQYWIYGGNHTPRVFGSWDMGFWKNANLTRIVPGEGADFEDSFNAPQFFFADGTEYLCYVSCTGMAEKATGYLRVVALPGTSSTRIDERLLSITDLDAVSERYALGAPSDLSGGGVRATNGTGYCQVLEKDGDIYILAGVTSAGMSLFRVNR